MVPALLQSLIGSKVNTPLPLDRVGRDGILRLAFERVEGQTVLTQRRFTLPLQALEPTPLDKDGSLFLMLLNPTGGLLGGDHLKTEVMLGPGAHVCLTTPSATKVYRTLGPPAVQETAIRLGEGAVLEYLPEHVIPHPGSALHQSLKIEMEAGSCAIISDAFAVGRLARGERWGFQEIVNQITVSSKGRSAFLERMRLVPSEMIPAALGGMEEFGYLATLVLVADSFGKWESVARALNELLTSAVSVLGGVSQISCGGCVVRFLAASAHDLTQMIRDLWSLARLLMLGLPAADLRKF